jgi:primary-amine oxidase
MSFHLRSFHPRILALLFCLLLLPACFALPPQVHHPLDALTPQEYWKAYHVLQDAGKIAEKTQFSSILLQEPAKSTVLAWKPGDPIVRKVDVVLLTEGKSYAAVIDISGETGKLDSWTELTNDQAPTSATENHGFDEEIKKDPRIIAALKARNLTDLRQVHCGVIPAGYVGLPEQTPGRRIGWGGCSYDADALFGWDRDIAGIFFVMDMQAKKITRFEDYGIVPMPPSTSIYDTEGGPALPGTKPIQTTLPEGPSFTIKDGEVSWQNWHFRFRLDPRVGPILNLVSYDDAGKRRSVLYEGSLSEMYVPYQDPDEGWNTHVFLDAGEFFANTGSGGIIKPLLAGVDCPTYATFFAGTFFHDTGTPYIRPQLACLFERVTGDPVWRHYDNSTGAVSGRPTRELIFRTVATVGNYDYIFDWRFEQDASINVALGATGILEVKAVKDQRADVPQTSAMVATDPKGRQVEFGQLISPGLSAVDHDHFFSYRLDLDVDGTNNSLMVDQLVPYKLPDNAPGRKWIWAMMPEMAKTESDAKLNVSIEHPAMWRFANEGTKNSLGQLTSYAIMPGETGISLLPSTEWPQKRAGFSEHNLWVTPYDPTQRYASGVYVMGSKGEDSLPAWTNKNRNIMNTDIVAWYTMGFHHVPRPEDWPQMPTMWHSFTLLPYQFLPKNPTMDLPMVP